MKLKQIRSKLINGKRYTNKELRQIRRNLKKKPKFSEEAKSIWYDVLDNSKKKNIGNSPGKCGVNDQNTFIGYNASKKK